MVWIMLKQKGYVCSSKQKLDITMFIKLDITMIQGPKNAFDFNNAKPAYYSLLRPVMPTFEKLINV